jgi:hypothetical protein
VATPTKAIITMPISIYRDWNGDDAEEGGPERWCDGLEHVTAARFPNPLQPGRAIRRLLPPR